MAFPTSPTDGQIFENYIYDSATNSWQYYGGNGVEADTVDGQNYTDIQSWVNTNADVPNADYADSAGDADTVNGSTITVSTSDPSGGTDGDIWIKV